MTTTDEIFTIIFKYNRHSEALHLKGLPIETIRLEAEINATHQLELIDKNTIEDFD